MWSNKRPISNQLTWTQRGREGRQSRGAQKTEEDLSEQEQADRLTTEKACLTHTRRKRNTEVNQGEEEKGGGKGVGREGGKTKHKKAQRQKINTHSERESVCEAQQGEKEPTEGG